MSPAARDGDVHALVRACYRAGTDLDALRAGLLHELQKLVPFDAAFFAATDPESLLFTSAFADEPLRDAGLLFLDNEFGDTRDVNHFAALATAEDVTGTLDRATGGDRRVSPRWRDIMRPLGLGDEARVALRVDGATWGVACLHRTGASPFGDRELRTLRLIAPHAAAALRGVAAQRPDGISPSDSPLRAFLLVNDHEVVAVADSASLALEGLGLPVRIGDPLPLMLLALVRRLELLERSGPVVPPAAIRMRDRDGRLVTIHAERLHDAGRSESIVLAIAPAGPREHASLLLSAFGLTDAQRQVARLVLAGRTTGEIVRDLHISEHTVQDHLKAIFDKVGVRSRRDLVSAVMRFG